MANVSSSPSLTWADAVPIVGNVISSVGDLFQSGMSGHQTRKTMREMNKWNLEQWYREVAQQEAWRDDERLYNSPSSVVSRLKAAGINPAFAMGAINGQMATPTVPKGHPAEGMVSPAPNFGSIGSAALNSLDRILQTHAAKNNIALQVQQLQTGRMSLLFKGFERILDIAHKTKDLGIKSISAKQLKKSYDFFVDTYKSNVGKAEADYQKVLADTSFVEQQERTAAAEEMLLKAQESHEKVKQRLDEAQISKVYQEIRYLAQEVVESNSRIWLNRAMESNYFQQALTERVRRSGLHITNSQLESNFPVMMRLLESEIDLNASKKFGAEWQGVGSALGAAAGAFFGLKALGGNNVPKITGFHK